MQEDKISNLGKLVTSLQTFDLKSETLLGKDAVRMMTMHKAKGLSSRLVIIPGLENGFMPNFDTDQEEARRLMYVAMTRSSEILIMTHVLERDFWQTGGNPTGGRSRFLREMQIVSQNGNDFANELCETLYQQNRPNQDDTTLTNIQRNDKVFDVFLAHNNRDKPIVELIAGRLKQNGIHPWLDKEQIPPGRWFQDEIQDGIQKAKCVAVFIGPNGVGKWQLVELRTTISQCVEKGLPVIPVLLPGISELPSELLILRELNWVSFSQVDDEEALKKLLWGIRAS